MRSNLGLALTLPVVLMAPVLAQEASTASGPDPDNRAGSPRVIEEVIVRGRRLSEIEFELRDYIRDFLDEVAAPARGRGYARWHRSVCVGVQNLQNDVAQYIVDRISALALEVGLEPGEPGCTPQVNIFFSTDARQMAAGMVESQPRAFRPVAGYAGADLGLEALDQFAASDRAVRWWHVSMPVDDRTGNPAIQTAGANCPQLYCYPVLSVAGPSRLYSGVRDDLLYVIIVVDASKLAGTTWQEIADYLAVVSLAQIDPNTDPREFDSILNLFSNPAAYSGLTDWDRQYLHALYDFRQDRIAKIQGSEIVNRIAMSERAESE